MRIGILLSTTRPARIGPGVGRWAAERVALSGAEADLLDLAEIRLPFLDEVGDPLDGRYELPHTRRWADRISALDGLVVVTAEYNASFPAPLKNALDILGPEWAGMPVTVIGYGGRSAGTRVVQALLPVFLSLEMLTVGALYLPRRERFVDGTFVPSARDDEDLDHLLSRVRPLARSTVASST